MLCRGVGAGPPQGLLDRSAGRLLAKRGLGPVEQFLVDLDGGPFRHAYISPPCICSHPIRDDADCQDAMSGTARRSS